MIEDEKPVFHQNHHQNSSKIIEENSENPPNLFQVLSNPLQQIHSTDAPKSY